MFQTKRFSRIFSLLFISLAVVFVSACGDDNDLDDFVFNNTNNNTLVGRYLGANNLNPGQVGNLDVTVAGNGAISGNYAVTNLVANQTVTPGSYPVTGNVSLTTGAFSLAGTIPGLGNFSINGSLPTAGNVAAYTILLNGQTFNGVIQPAAQGVPNPPANNNNNNNGKIVSGGVVSNFIFTPNGSYNGVNPPVSISSQIAGAVGTGVNNEDSITLVLTETSINGQNVSSRLLTVSAVIPAGEDFQVGTTYNLVDNNGRGSFLTLSTVQGVAASEGWAIGPNTTGSVTLVALNDTSVTLDFTFTNLVDRKSVV